MPGGAREEGVLVSGLWEEAGLLGWQEGETDRSLGIVSLRPSLYNHTSGFKCVYSVGVIRPLLTRYKTNKQTN